MGQLVLTDAFFSINAVDMSDHVKQITLNYKAEIHDKTAMSALSRARISGLKDWDVRVELHQDYAAGETDATLFGIVGTSVAIEIRPTSAAVGATNPKFTGNGIVQDYPPVAGSVGELAMAAITVLGNGVLTRATA